LQERILETTSLLSFASLMLFVAPASATSGLAIVSGLGSFVVALESVVARGGMMALNKEIADLTSRVNQLERAAARARVPLDGGQPKMSPAGRCRDPMLNFASVVGLIQLASIGCRAPTAPGAVGLQRYS
jgi:hypothetical protein